MMDTSKDTTPIITMRLHDLELIRKGMMERLSNRKWRELLRRYIFGRKEAE